MTDQEVRDHADADSERNNRAFLQLESLAADVKNATNLTDFEIRGFWLWVRGDTKPHKEYLKTAGFRWSPKQGAWYFAHPNAPKSKFGRAHHKRMKEEPLANNSADTTADTTADIKGDDVAVVLTADEIASMATHKVVMRDGKMVMEDKHEEEDIVSQTSQPKKNMGGVKVERAFRNILDERFIKTDDVASILSVAIQGNKNVILYGPAGHGKSEMVTHLCNAVYGKEHVFVQSFGEGMDESQLWGGIDFKHLEQEKVLQYAPQRSFLNYRLAIFEEIFDAPAFVLLSLKDALTARELRKGEQTFKMRTECIIALTNKDPQEISDMGPAAHALIERFPLRYNMRWDSYTAQDFRDLFNKVYPRRHTDIKKTLADIIHAAIEKGSFISPRSAIHALEVCVVNKDSGEDAFNYLRFVPGFESVMDDLKASLHESRVRSECTEKIAELDTRFRMEVDMLQTTEDPVTCLKAVNALRKIDGEMEFLAVTDDFISKKDQIRSEVADAIKYASDKAMDLAYKL